MLEMSRFRKRTPDMNCLRLKSLSFLLPLALVWFALVSFSPAQIGPAGSLAKLPLRDGWALESSAKVNASGEEISSEKFPVPSGWIRAEVPTTVVAAEVKNGLLPDPFFGTNLRQYPGLNYPIGANFSNLQMPPDSPYGVSWWYRDEFALPDTFAGKTVWLNFRGINYRANIFLNGKKIADSDHVVGAWRTYELDVTKSVRAGTNVLAVQVWAPTEKSLAITFVDWNPAPPDKNMGLFREVYLTASGPVAVRNPAVLSKVDSPSNQAAHLTVAAVLKNASDHAIKGTLRGTIAGAKGEVIEFAQDFELASEETKDVMFAPERYQQLNLSHPRLWWPAQMGKPYLYELSLSFEVDGTVSDASRTQFGIREITSEVTEEAPDRYKRLFKVNGKNLLIRGGGWTPDMMLRQTHERLEDEFRFVRDLGLNAVRLEGKLETEDFFAVADREGILVMAGWCCCDFWEHWGSWKDEDFEIAEQSLRDQMYRLRGHPSLLVWLNGSDNPPPPDVEQTYLKVEKELLWPNPVISSATAKTTTLTGESGGKMSGPYEYVAPSYWQTDPYLHKTESPCNPGGCGGAYGFNMETSMGPAVPPLESMERMVPKDHVWSANGALDDDWSFHAGGGKFKNIEVFADALKARYGPASSAEEFTYKSQLMTYEGVRAMYEAYSRNKYASTGVIQWMLNNAWPSIIWHLYDYYLRPGGGYFGAKKATQPLDPVYGYDDHAIWLVSSQYVDAAGLKLTARVFNSDGTQDFSKEVAVDAAADSTRKILELPKIDGLSETYFLDLRLTDGAGKLVGSNFYWLSTKPETLDWAKSNWYTTPTASFADYRSLAEMAKVKLNVSQVNGREGDDTVTRVTIENPSKSIAFFVRLKLDKNRGGEEILPVIWEDNYISLLPGEKREIVARCHSTALAGSRPEVEVSGWNVE
jgi:exo-1,4-beta-D-glucosaminidase